MTPEIKIRIDQIRRGEVPKGYQKVKKNIFPIEWEYRPLSDIVSISQGYTFSRNLQGKSKGDWNYFKVADIGLSTNTKYLRKAVNMIDDSVAKSIGATPFEAGSIVFPRVGAALFNNNRKIIAQDSIVDDNVLAITIRNKKICSNEFLYYALLLVRLEDWCNSGLVPVINSKTVLKYQVCLPELFEQQKIAAILTTQDKIIELKENLLTEKQRQKKYLVQQLLTGKKRLPGFADPWKKIKLCQVLTERTEKNEKQHLHICSVAVQKGVVDQVEHLGRSYAAADTSNYGAVYHGDIIYTKSPTGDFPYGIIKQSQLNKKVAVSPLYGIYKPISFAMGYLLHTYFGYAINAKNYLLPVVQKGAKNTINITNSRFISNSLYLPMDPKEQSALAEVFTVADKEIRLLQQSLEQEKQKKKALMQLLLTGIVRVNI